MYNYIYMWSIQKCSRRNPHLNPPEDIRFSTAFSVMKHFILPTWFGVSKLLHDEYDIIFVRFCCSNFSPQNTPRSSGTEHELDLACGCGGVSAQKSLMWFRASSPIPACSAHEQYG